MSDMTPSLRALAAAASPGPWRLDGTDIDQLTDGGAGYPLNVYPDSKTIVVGRCEDCGSYDSGIQSQADAAYIAAISPPVLLQLLDTLDAVTRERDALKALLDTPWPDSEYGDEPKAIAFREGERISFFVDVESDDFLVSKHRAIVLGAALIRAATKGEQ